MLKSRLCTLDEQSLEEYLPDCLYEKCGLNKAQLIDEIKRETKYEKICALKERVSKAVAGVLTREDIKDLSIIVEAIDKADAD